ncbi:MAG: hypothetical protein J3Q66DRAFT_437195 [Benniella sp.]|nr:MAG: hypothetical protein J3Q66DRAFT_437195 [Benniella sp.]
MIGCTVRWISVTISHAISSRTEAIQSGNTFVGCTFRIMEVDDFPIWDPSRPFDKHDHYRSKITFPFNSSQYTMETGFIMHKTSHNVQTILPEPTADIILKYGGTLVTFRAPSSFSDHHVELLDVVTELRGSKLEILDVDPTNLSNSGLECLRRVLGRSKNLDMSRMQSWARKWKFKMDGWDVEE